MVDLTALAATAKRLVEANGRAVTLYRKSRTADDPSQPWRGPDLTSPDDTEAVTMAFVPASGTGMGKELFERGEGGLVRAIDQVGLLAATSAGSFVVEQGDSVVDGTTAWRVVAVEALKPGDAAILYVLGLKA